MALPGFEGMGVQMSVEEIEGVTGMFNKMADMCYKKCVPRLREPEFTVAEGACVDRCVVKYMEVHQKVGQRLGAQMGGAPGSGGFSLPGMQ